MKITDTRHVNIHMGYEEAQLLMQLVGHMAGHGTHATFVGDLYQKLLKDGIEPNPRIDVHYGQNHESQGAPYIFLTTVNIN